MTCERIRQLLSDYLDGELSSAVTTRVQSHLYGCAACEREHQALRRTVQLLAGHGRQRVPVDCREAVLARLRSGEEVGGAITRRGTGAGNPSWWRALVPDFSLPPRAPGGAPSALWARASAVGALALLCVGGAWLMRPDAAGGGGPQLAAIGPGSERGRIVRPVSQEPTPAEELRRFHAPDHFGQAMGRDNGIILVSDWVDSP